MEKVKIIFLDVDGVLNIMSRSYNSFKLTSNPLESHLVSRLEFIIERVSRGIPVRIVISSSWHIDDIIKSLKNYSFKYINDIIGRTPRNVHNYRGEQIKDWLDAYLDKYNIYSYIVLEDEIADVCGSKCSAISSDNVIEVNMDEGLSHKDCINAIHKLNKLVKPLVEEVYVNTSEYRNYFIKLGFEPSVISPENEQWKSFRVIFKNMMLIMKRS